MPTQYITVMCNLRLDGPEHYTATWVFLCNKRAPIIYQVQYDCKGVNTYFNLLSLLRYKSFNQC